MPELSRLRSQFTVMLAHLDRAWRREADAALAVHGLSAATALPLLVVGRLGNGIRQVQLAEAMGIEEASLTPVLRQLDDAALVTRRTDPRDRRAKALDLTDAGAALAETAERVLAAVRGRLLDGVDAADLEAALRVFHAMERSVGRNKLPPAREPAKDVA